MGLALLIVAAALGGLLAGVFRFAWTAPTASRRATRRAGTAVTTLLVALAAVELVFQHAVAVSDAFEQTLAARNWHARFWRPVNERGYRDVEHPAERLSKRKVAFVVGDSFVAGSGIEDPADRFADVLGARLGEGWEVVNVAKRGWSTRAQGAALAEYGHAPDLVVLSWGVNDIEGAASREGLERPPLAPLPGGALGALIERSHLANFVYWRLFRRSAAMARAYARYLEACFADERVWSRHRRELLAVLAFTRARGARLVVVVFPNLFDVDSTRPYTRRVIALFRENGVETIDVADRVHDWPVERRVVNAFDGHPGVELHHAVGAWLYRVVEEEATPPARD